MRGLGYEKYGAQGGDFGAGVTTYMALDDPAAMLGIHLSTPEVPPYTGPDARPLSADESEYVAQNDRWAAAERGYSAIQSTKPQTLGYALNDSPAGLAAWIVEKWRSWTDSHGDPDAHLSREFLLTTITLYWATQTVTPSMRDYYDNRWFAVPIGPGDHVVVPTAVAMFGNHFIDEGIPPREWFERLYNVRQWTPMPSGGHFAAVEEPELLARDIASFFAAL
jgi:pimeloyl-ACP methyl ester carboxylesterase